MVSSWLTGPARTLPLGPTITLLPGSTHAAVVGLLTRPHPVAVREVGRDLVDVQARVDADHVAAALARDVPHGRDPAVAAGRGSGAAQMSTPCAYR